MSGGRGIPTPLEAEIAKPVVNPFLAIRIELPDPVYVFSGVGRISFADSDSITRTWLGAGEVGAIDTIGEATDGSATGIKVSLNNIPSEFAADIADQAVRGVKFEIYAGALNETYQTVVSTVLIWRGKLDNYRITDSGASLSVEITGESRAIDQRRPAIKRFTDEWQQRKYSGDLFFQYVPRMTEVAILWGKAEQNSITSGGGGGYASAAASSLMRAT